jgi:hypothetical protein
MSLTFDEYGRPYIIVRDQGTKTRLKGLEAQKVSWISEDSSLHCSLLSVVSVGTQSDSY